MKKEKQNTCHSRVSLLGISTLIKQSGGDPRLQASGMTNGKINSHSRVFLSGISTVCEQRKWRRSSTTTFEDDPRRSLAEKVRGGLYPSPVAAEVRGGLYPSPLAGEGRVRGFTLIELLIAVIIIAVLATIAVSAYQKAVLKSRFSSVIPPTKTIADAQEFHYMNEGSYATQAEDLDVKVNSKNNTITLSNKRTYKYVMGTPDGAENNHYIMYQKHSKRFANDIHCEAQKDDARANWLCETGLGGTRIDGSISGSNWLTYLLSGEGSGKFVREDCAEGYYDDNGRCTIAPRGYYADDGELKPCEMGTHTGVTNGNTSCKPCPGGTYNNTEGSHKCDQCGYGYYQPETGQTSCLKCPVGTHTGVTVGNTSCKPCPGGTYNNTEGSHKCDQCGYGYYQPETGQTSCLKCPVGTYTGVKLGNTSCKPCPEGTYTNTEGNTACQKCPSGTTSNADHTACVSI